MTTLVAVGIFAIVLGGGLLLGRTRLVRFDASWERRAAAKSSPLANPLQAHVGATRGWYTAAGALAIVAGTVMLLIGLIA
ncbi:hypothetical protein [Geodermatophilus sp. FMUSA9-8]|uniref:hypothetical protein n=1 Tax=Geodermatophilus sp. FMUSA9-8 TaxID=3120155 RepID=UPI003008E116